MGKVSAACDPDDDVDLVGVVHDTFQTAMHIASVYALDEQLLPKVTALCEAIERKAQGWTEVMKIGRTHLEDAVPLTVAREWYGWAGQIRAALADVERSRKQGLYQLAVGGTAVGTGLDRASGVLQSVRGENRRAHRQTLRHRTPTSSPRKGRSTRWCGRARRLRGLAVGLVKIANDMRWLASGPRCGLGELKLPANEPGS